ncbi:transcriptional regulator, AraC family [Nocardioides sp. YR527]|uniref:AraC family transcriptional regulator n=1 Tax=Nocardioides sp. YR527 TaxID=1881028 RepID=UPI0008864371|nr:AraC family transcriptional regulator [Nocardioides sp. YR527]SDK28089.1 transcriptional regulator, AraC family [Nocardioides sp. YR527]
MSNSSTISADLTDIDEARSLGGEVFYPHDVSVTHRGDPFCVHLNVRTFGPLKVGMLSYESTVRIDTGPLGDGYQLNAPSKGAIRTTYGQDRVTATPAMAAVHSPHRPTRLEGWGGGEDVLAVKMDRFAVEDTLERLLGHPLRAPLEMAPGLALDHGPGQELWQLVRILIDQVPDVRAGGLPGTGGSVFDASPVAASLAQSVITGLLYAHEHNYAEELRSPAPAGGPAAIRAAVAYIEEHAAEPIGVTDVADHAGLCVRALQQGFARHLQKSPSGFLRQVRLGRVRDALLASDAETTTVATVAAGWGFFSLGRFAAQYREAYGETPSQTLRRTL